MSGLAEILLSLGFQVSGSDARQSAVTERLSSLGATVQIGHRVENLPKDLSTVVYSSAVPTDNPEMLGAKERNVPAVRRAEVLAELMRLKFGVGVAGSHGKTSTTSMVAAIMEELDPTVVIGGIVKSLGTGGRVGNSSYLVAETDESDRSFLLMKPSVAVVTNIDEEHLDAYESVTDLEQSFAKFISAVPFYGVSILCIDDPKVRALAEQHSGRVITYGASQDAQYQYANLKFNGLEVSFDLLEKGEVATSIALPLAGEHFASNAVAAIAVGREFGISYDVIREALAHFGGVERRLERLGETSEGAPIISDYAHHPTEIVATLKALREALPTGGKLHAVFQPHRYSRTRDVFPKFADAFKDADALYLAEIYSAGEKPIEGISNESLFDSIVHKNKSYIGELSQEWMLSNVAAGDTVVFLGAGSVGAYAIGYAGRH